MIDYIISHYENNLNGHMGFFDVFSELRNVDGRNEFEQAYKVAALYFQPEGEGVYKLQLDLYDGIRNAGSLYIVERTVYTDDVTIHTKVFHGNGGNVIFKNLEIKDLTVNAEKAFYEDTLEISSHNGLHKVPSFNENATATLVLDNCVIELLTTNKSVYFHDVGNNIIGNHRKSRREI